MLLICRWIARCGCVLMKNTAHNQHSVDSCASSMLGTHGALGLLLLPYSVCSARPQHKGT